MYHEEIDGLARMSARSPHPGVDPEGPPAYGFSLENLGVGQAQGLAHLPHTRFSDSRPVAIQEASYTGDSGVALFSAVVRFNCEAPVNYIVLSPSVRGNDLYVSLAGDVGWQVYGSGIGRAYYPVTDYRVPAGSPSVQFTFPVVRNLIIAAVVIPAPGYVAPYEDMVRIAYGYEPVPSVLMAGNG